MKKRLFFAGCLLLAAFGAAAQPVLSNLRSKTLPFRESWQTLDSLTIAPGSVRLFNAETGDPLDSIQFEIANNQVRFKISNAEQELLNSQPTPNTQLLTPNSPTSNLQPPASIFITYRVLPVNFSAPISRLDSSQIRIAYEGVIFNYQVEQEKNKAADFGKLNYDGSFSRGLSFGNSQNLVLNSNFNLQMSGKLTDDVEIAAALTDNSLPLQVEGNTAQLQELDKVFIQLKRKNAMLVAGDYELLRPQGRHFMNYFKKLQGATFSLNPKNDEKNSLQTRASVAIARGKFARNIVAPLEGNQGPYRLRGAESETFIIILAGTERVYLNGQLLQRGVEADYTIDYNAANLTFMPRRLITKDSRIVVEFDYTDQSYLRSLYAMDLDYKTANARVYGSFYADQDSRSSGADGPLSDLEKQSLRNVGDQPLGALVNGIEPLDDFNALRITYQLKDTVICGSADSILVYSTTKEGQLYTARFTEVGQGNGNYVLDRDLAANGRVYRWAPPVNCQKQGSFEPVTRLSAPKQQQLFSVGTEVRLSANSGVQAEVSMSHFDLNRLSDLDAGDDLGWAGSAKFHRNFKLDEEENGWQARTDWSYEFVHRNFSPLAPWRPQEFARDWNLSNARNGQLGDNNLPRAPENLAQANLTLTKPGLGNLQYNFGGFWRADSYTGNRHFSKISLSRNGWAAWAEGSLLSSETSVEKSCFLRPKFSVEKTIPKWKNWKIGLSGERESNRRKALAADTLQPTSFQYDFLKINFLSPTDEKFSIGVEASHRWDYLPKGSNFKGTTQATDLGLNGLWQHAKTARLEWLFSYRYLQAATASQPTNSTYLGRLTYDLALWKGALRSATSYEIGSGQESKIEFNYLRVNDGEGVYQWNDYNRDSILQVNEFEVAVFSDSANFVRVTVVTDEFLQSDNVQFNQSLRLEPKAVWHKNKGARGFLSRFSTLSTWQITRRVREAQGVSPWNPFQLEVPDTALVALNSGIRNTLFFNRADPKYDLHLGMTNNRNRVIVTTGFEARHLQEQFFQARWNFTRQWSLKGDLKHAFNGNDSENFQNRDYNIGLWKISPELIWLPNNSFRSALNYEWRDGGNTLPNEEHLRVHHFNVEMIYNLPANDRRQPTSVRAKLTFAKVEFEGQANSPAGFAMLEGLRHGENYLWNFVFDRQLSKNIRLNISYEGRKTGDSRVVHIGRAQVAAVF